MKFEKKLNYPSFFDHGSCLGGLFASEELPHHYKEAVGENFPE